MSDAPPPIPPVPPIPPHEHLPPPSADPSRIEPKAGAMDPVVPLVIGFFLGPIAYFFFGQWQKAVVFLVVGVTLIVITCGVMAPFLAPLNIAMMLDAYFQAKNLKEGRAIRQWTFFNQFA